MKIRGATRKELATLLKDAYDLLSQVAVQTGDRGTVDANTVADLNGWIRAVDILFDNSIIDDLLDLVPS